MNVDSPQNTALNRQPVIIVHGGISDALETWYMQWSALGTKQAAAAGYRVLQNGGTCVDAVVNAVKTMEDNPAFNAGRGSLSNEEGQVEMHALVMRGDTCNCGGVSGIKGVKNPVDVAHLVLEHSHHSLLNGNASLELARRFGLEEKPPEYFKTDMTRKRLQQRRTFEEPFYSDHNAVGAVARDCHGNVACATSSGGISIQSAGRISDCAIAGSGGFADNSSVAVVATGHGDSILNVNLSRLISIHVENGMSPQEASQKSLEYMWRKTSGRGGVISLDPGGRVGIHFTTPKMSWARIGGESPYDSRNISTNNFIQFGFDMVNISAEKL
ncbi:isoaspartyl peptidase/L-asparaginase-like [Clavelina lepadiformis]|uniref:isoaspartyl peptidase/L-asparaginase-like n=1 Tax=Clavelina lepadiformis TaxID=159417 RepID=UPI0040420E1F